MKILNLLILLNLVWTLARGENSSDENVDEVEFIGHELLESRLDFMQQRFSELFMKLANTIERNQNLTEQKLADVKDMVTNNARFSLEKMTNTTEQKYKSLSFNIQNNQNVFEQKLDALSSNIVANNSRISDSLDDLVNTVKKYQQSTNENMLNKLVQVINETNKHWIMDLAVNVSAISLKHLGTLTPQNQQSRENKSLSENRHVDKSPFRPIQKIQETHSCKNPGVVTLLVSHHIKVLCEMKSFDGGWIVIQQRKDLKLDFTHGWNDYRDGFGVIGEESDFWLGNEAIHQLTNSGEYELVVELKDFGRRYGFARYSKFHVAGENDKYRLTVGGYSGDLGDQLGSHDKMQFFTSDSDTPDSNFKCGNFFNNGWWFLLNSNNYCYDSNLNTQGKYGIFWRGWTSNASYSRMMIRRK